MQYTLKTMLNTHVDYLEFEEHCVRQPRLEPSRCRRDGTRADRRTVRARVRVRVSSRPCRPIKISVTIRAHDHDIWTQFP